MYKPDRASSIFKYMNIDKNYQQMLFDCFVYNYLADNLNKLVSDDAKVSVSPLSL